MSSSRSLTQLDASQYDAIEDAVRETERGRWFLAEYARRNRNADTEVLLGAIRRIESAVSGPRDDDVGRFRGDLMEMADAIARTRAEVAALSTPEQGESRLTAASEALDAIVRATERATSDILGAAEEVQEVAWTLRESGADSALCDTLDRHATQIYTACSFQDLTAQRTSRVVHTLRYLENRIASMIGIWGHPDDAVPSLDQDARPAAASPLDQSDVDRFLDMEGPVPAAASLPPLPAVALDDIAFLPEQPEPALDVALAADPSVEGVLAEEIVVAEAACADATLADSAFAEEEETAFEPAVDAVETVIAQAPEPELPTAVLDNPAEPEVESQEDEAQSPMIQPAEPILLAAPEMAAPEAVAPQAAPVDDLAAAFPDLDALSIEEKIALFA